MRIVVASGKGGVGKSMLTSSLAVLLSKERKIVACDCDVDAPNLGLWLGITKYNSSKPISASERAFIDQNACKRCGRCFEACKFGAIEKIKNTFRVNRFLCEGCGACKLVCPTNAISIKPVENAEIRTTYTSYGFPLISGKLYPGETGSGKIVEELKKEIEQYNWEIAIFDAPAGIGCPVIATLRGCDFAVLVTEPTPSGLSDVKRVLKLVKHFNLPYGMVINKWDINTSITKKIEKTFKEKVIGKISFDKEVVTCITNLKPVIETDLKVADEILKIYETLYQLLKL